MHHLFRTLGTKIRNDEIVNVQKMPREYKRKNVVPHVGGCGELMGKVVSVP